MLSDCRKTGKVIGSAVASGSGGVAYVKNGTLSVYGVTLTGGSAATGGAVSTKIPPHSAVTVRIE